MTQSRRQESKSIVGKPAPEFAAATLNGSALVRLRELRGRPVLLDFWATWCAPCRDQMPGLAKLYRDAKDKGLVLIGVNDDETPEQAAAYLREHQYDWPTVYDHKDGALQRDFKVFGIPTLVLIDKDGIVT